ncbi:MAG TPA: cytochrome c3 family protein [Dissulfurispiraceae bacterium]|nr:cytochrome c3 family protein [Dissulfurispiraceae bacterium]
MRINENLKGLILAIVVIVIFLYGYRYYRYTQDDPDFCSSCHVVKEAEANWLNGSHRNVLCQNCHQLGNLEQNLRLISYIMTGRNPIALTHGRFGPWEECRNCHMDTISQGSVSPTKTYGHARHVLVQKVECRTCHISTDHDFPPNGAACEKCHQGKGVHGMEVEGFSCLKCHSFTRQPLPMLSRTLCVGCHTDLPAKGAMSGLSCHYCHIPHTKEKPTQQTCTIECHRSQASLGQHGLHVKQGIDCMHCHKPHTWSAKERVRQLCSECHAFRDSKGFRYIF